MSGNVLMNDLLRPRIGDWRLAQRERELFEAAPQIPTWRLADNCRRVLLDVCRQLWDRTPAPSAALVDELPALEARRLASLELGQLVVRATGAQMMLIATGYEREGIGQVRVSTEALLRTRQVLDDASGNAARTLLKGQRPRSLKSLAHRYGHAREIEILDRFSHADPLSLRPLGPPRAADEREAVVEMRPQRGLLRPAQQLLDASHTCVMQGAAMVEIFEVGLRLSPWISGQFNRYKSDPLPPPL